MLNSLEIGPQRRPAPRPSAQERTVQASRRSAICFDLSLEQQRLYNRGYMRRWRAASKNRKREKQTRHRAWLKRKLNGDRKRSPRVCAFCNYRQSVTTVARLEPLPRGFVEVRLPYCGEC